MANEFEYLSKSGNIFKSGLLEDQISNGLVFEGSSCSYGPFHLKTGPFKIEMIMSRFQIFFDKIAAMSSNGLASGFHDVKSGQYVIN